MIAAETDGHFLRLGFPAPRAAPAECLGAAAPNLPDFPAAAVISGDG
jgi:hypothetical protein